MKQNVQNVIYRIKFDKDGFYVNQKQCVRCLNIRDSCKWIQIFKVQLVLLPKNVYFLKLMNWVFGRLRREPLLHVAGSQSRRVAGRAGQT